MTPRRSPPRRLPGPPSPPIAPAVAVALLAALATTPVAAQQPDPAATAALDTQQAQAATIFAERPIEDELILVVTLGRYTLSDGLIGYLNRGDILLPLGEMARALDFAIVTDPAAGQAEGWFLSENRRFALDIGRREIVVEGRRLEFPAGRVEAQFDDIYVDSAVLARWFPIDLDYDLSALAVRVASREPLPIEQRLERQSERRFLGGGGTARPSFDRVDTPHTLLDWPFIETSLDYGYDRTDGVGDHDWRFGTLITGDLLFLDANAFIAGSDDDELSTARLELGRTDPDAGLLGFLTEFSAGDIFAPQIPLAARSQGGRGARLSSFPVTRSSEFDRTTLRGDLPPGFEVELYRNDVLLDFQISRADGRYEFLDVPLLFGNNVLRLVFYGPQGQRREEVQVFQVGEGLVRPGEQHIALAAIQQDEELFAVADRTGSVDPDQGEMRGVAEYELGITNRLSLAASAASYSLDGVRHDYANLGARATLLGTFVRLDGSSDLDSGSAVLASLQGSALGLNFLAEHSELSDYRSDVFDDDDDPLRRRSRLRFDGSIPEFAFVPRINFSLGGVADLRQSGQREYAADNRLSMSLFGAQVSNTLNLELDRGEGAPETTDLDGQFLLNSRWGRLLLRGDLSYTIQPERSLDAVSVTADYSFTPDTSGRLTVDRQITGTSRTNVSLGLNTLFDNVAVGFSGNVDDNGDFAAGLSISFALGRDPRRDRPVVERSGAASGGAVSARVFLDGNQNRRFDDGETPIEGVRFTGGYAQRETDADGIAFLSDLGSHVPTPVAIDLGSIEDPYWIPVVEGYEIVPRPGKTILLDFPVTPTGEIDGIIFLRRGDELTEVSNAQVELVDESGAATRQAVSAFDGFYLFDLVRPGRYLLRIAPEQVERLGLIAPPEREVLVGGDGDIVSGIDFILDRP